MKNDRKTKSDMIKQTGKQRQKEPNYREVEQLMADGIAYCVTARIEADRRRWYDTEGGETPGQWAMKAERKTKGNKC